MNSTDRSFLREVAHRGWKQGQATFPESQLSGTGPDRSAIARAEIERAVADYLRMEQEPGVDGQGSPEISTDALRPESAQR